MTSPCPLLMAKALLVVFTLRRPRGTPLDTAATLLVQSWRLEAVDPSDHTFLNIQYPDKRSERRLYVNAKRGN